MKKLTALFIVLCITASLFALEEVRGIETRIAKYPAGDTPGEETRYEGYGGNPYYTYNLSGVPDKTEKPFELAGFELKNENNYPVWVEVELYRKSYSETSKIVPESVVATKNISLQAGESYLWKTNILVSTCSINSCDTPQNSSCTK